MGYYLTKDNLKTYITAYGSVNKVPRPYIVGVRGFVGILIHEGNTAKNTEGCVLVGDNTVKGKVLYSKVHIGRLCAVMTEAIARHEAINLAII